MLYAACNVIELCCPEEQCIRLRYAIYMYFDKLWFCVMLVIYIYIIGL